MNLLLDTHVFLWWENQNPALSSSAHQSISSADNSIYVSAASVWEIAIKWRLGKLAFSGSATSAIDANGFCAEAILPIDAENAGDLAWSHGDPFDRLLVVQAIRLGCMLVTADRSILAFGAVPHLWAR